MAIPWKRVQCGNGRGVCGAVTFLSIVGGVDAGVLGLTELRGFLCYFLVIMLLASAGIAAKVKFDTFSYLDSWNGVTLDGIA